MISLSHSIKRPVKGYTLFRVVILMMLLCCSHLSVSGQYFDMKDNRKHVTIPFQMIRDMIIIKLTINNKGPFNFILDTGVGLMLITDPKLVDSINIVNKRTLKISGIGEGDAYEAYVTSSLNIQIPGLVSYDVAAAILKTDHFGLSNFAGIPIHGLLGYEFFNNLAVKINFSDSTLSVSRPIDMRIFRKGNKIPITVEDRKPYIKTRIVFPDGSKAEDKLILDLGAGHSLSLENVINKNGLPEKFIAANLGVGLTGPVNGFLSRVKELDIGKFKLKNVITSFPEGEQFKSLAVKRDGNLGIGILKRFNVIIDYPDSVIYLQQGINFKTPFEHDMSGLEYYASGTDFNRVIISRVEPGSPADMIGLEKDDEILMINLKPVMKMTLEQIDNIFKSQNDRSLLLEIYHDNRRDDVILTLKRRI
nr:aspartyl protease family protein [Mucilaginibacter phenanthrenivorans]